MKLFSESNGNVRQQASDAILIVNAPEMKVLLAQVRVKDPAAIDSVPHREDPLREAVTTRRPVVAPRRQRLQSRATSGTDSTRRSTPVHGIDVSRHNGMIDWNAVASAGVNFAWVKASEGDVRDPRFVGKC